MKIKEVSLKEFWTRLGDDVVTFQPKRKGKVVSITLLQNYQRAERMEIICEAANMNYNGLKLVMNNHRRLSVRAIDRLHKAANDWAERNKFGYRLDKNDLLDIARRIEVRDTRKTHLSKY